MPERDHVEIERLIRRELDGISDSRQLFDLRFVSLLLRTSDLALRRWLLLANVSLIAILLGAGLAPLLRAWGLHDAGSLLFWAYGAICAQTPEHSYYLLGYQMALDQRMMAIDGSALLAGLVFGLVRSSARPLSWRVYVLLILPMAADGLTQLFGWRHSTWELRTITGALFGVGTVWLTYPRLNVAWPPLRRLEDAAGTHHAVINL